MSTLLNAGRSIGLYTMLGVAGFVWYQIEAPSPGPLSSSHAQEKKLMGQGSCARCHGGEDKRMREACCECHDIIGQQLEQGMGFHAQIDVELVQNCDTCHIEHLGGDVPVVGKRSFMMAGYTRIEDFDHKGLGMELEGKHLEVHCRKCHKLADAQFIPKGKRRFQGLSQDCTDCHKDQHEGKLPDCASCHGQEKPFEQVANFEHNPRFPLIGGHAGVACKKCHEAGGAHSLPSLSKAATKLSQDLVIRDCSACHDTPHQPKFIRGVALAILRVPSQTCSECHKPEDGTFHGATLTAELHVATGFARTKPHDKVSCEKCHAGYLDREALAAGKTRDRPFGSLYPNRHADECVACHGDHHEGQFDEGAFAGKNCLTCHHRDQFKNSKFTVELHDKAEFKLEGAHRLVECSRCHVRPRAAIGTPDESRSRIFRGTAKECETCHEGPHGGQFSEGPFAGKGCGFCHKTDAFRPPCFTIETHKLTGFPLEGAHQAVGCVKCHHVAKEQDPSGKAAPRKFHGNDPTCSSCHEDVHRGTFDRPGLPKTHRNKSSCGRCHDPTGFCKIAEGVFDHEKWTGFSLKGMHAKAKCSFCHLPGTSTHKLRAFGIAKKNCSDCHVAPHAGQFKVDGKTDCHRCHRPGEDFDNLLFDHDKDARFSLDKNHSKLECSACHKPYPLPGGGKIVRYKPLGTQCKDCHGEFIKKGKKNRR